MHERPAQPEPIPARRLRLLLVSDTDDLTQETQAAAAAIGAQLDVMPSVNQALAWLLRPDNLCTHLLAPAGLPPTDIVALAAMVDEVTRLPAPLLLLGATDGFGPNIRAVPRATQAAITHALRDFGPFVPAPLPELTADTLHALWRDGALQMRFQPILDATSLTPIGLEMLLRLHHASLGILRPKDFLGHAIALGEERTLVGAAVFAAVMQLQSALTSLHAQIPGIISVNTPVLTFCSDTGPDRAALLCAASGLRHDQFVLELLETPTLPDMDAVETALTRWHQAGFRVVLDDAGPPLPHWRQMMELPFDGVKLDASLAADTPAARAEAAAIVQTATKRGMRVVAEGIEDQAALDRARALGIGAVQGFMFSRPLPTRAVPLWLEAWQQG